ncbi:WD40 repeat domain-containing protein [Streptomyces sp. NRRL B-24484]|uniref:WD40 repeat domain-containing protein n=1 Tax=Streptomyces sp. NRRL B-24484 TaxID=1463833 RepID=UPI0013319874|nr:WD40 repeat domain-containing protein [Streptomyces sp. NRRL B-24484]
MTGDPEQVVAALDGAAGPEEVAAAAVYRTSGHLHRDAGAGVRRQLLALDAARYGHRELMTGLAAVPVRQEEESPWAVRWATGTGLDSRLRYALPAPAGVTRVATVVAAGRGFAVAGCEDGTLHWWDPATGRKLGSAAPGRAAGRVWSLATAVLDGCPVAVTCSSDGAVLVWDLVQGVQLAEYRTDGDAQVLRLATATVGGRPVVVAGGLGGRMWVWDVAEPGPGGELLTIRTDHVQSLATAVVDGRPVLVTGHAEGAVRRWDLTTGRAFGSTDDRSASDLPAAADTHHGDEDKDEDGDDGFRRCITMEVNAMTHLMATDPASGSPLAISADAYRTYVWNLATGEELTLPFPEFAEAAALAVIHGRPTALVSGSRGTVSVWDLSADEHQHWSLTGHEGTVRGTATVAVQGRHLAVTGGDDRSVRIWDLGGEPGGEAAAGSRPDGRTVPGQRLTTTVLDGRSVIVSGGPDAEVRIWDLDSGEQLGAPLSGHTGAVVLLAVGTVDGRLLLLTRDRHQEVRIWDLTARKELHGRSTGEYASSFIDHFAVVDGHFVAVTSEGRVWDLATSAWTGVRPGQNGALALETLEGRSLVLTGHRTDTVRLWDVATGEPAGPPLTGHTGEVTAGAVGMLDGQLVVATGSTDGTVRVWHAITGRQVGTYAFPAGINELSVAADGQLVVAFGSDVAVLTHR